VAIAIDGCNILELYPGKEGALSAKRVRSGLISVDKTYRTNHVQRFEVVEGLLAEFVISSYSCRLVRA
jgi:hypothetical protein